MAFTAPAQNQLPPGGVAYFTPMGVIIVYDYHGLKLIFGDADGSANVNSPGIVGGGALSMKDWQAQINTGQAINVGPASQLTGTATQLNGQMVPFNAWLDDKIQVLSGNNPEMASDPELRKLFVLRATNEIDDSELQARLQQTNYWKTRTTTQRNWATLSPAEQQLQINDAAATLRDTYFRNVGTELPENDATLMQWAQKVASGTSSQGLALEEWIKPTAEQNAQSPWSRTIEQEKENQRQQGVDISNEVQTVTDLYNRWGISSDPGTLKDIATKIVTKQMAEGDLVQQLKTQAQTLYPWKDPNMETLTAADPWLSKYASVYETSKPDIQDPTIQKALTNGTPLYQFEQDLKTGSPANQARWLQTQNAKQSLGTVAADMGRQMGFN